MSLIEKIRNDQLLSRKNNSPDSSLLTTLLSEASMVGKNNGNRESTDEEVINVIKKFIKNNKELMSSVNEDSIAYQKAKQEIELLSSYLPQQMTEDEIKKAVQQKICTLEDISPKLMGNIMKWLKENYSGQYDGAVASKIVKELLKGNKPK